MSKHTPTPWILRFRHHDANEHHVDVRAFAGTYEVGALSGMSRANRVHVIKCVNSHDKLVEALQRAVSIIEDLPYPSNHPASDFEALLENMRMEYTL